MLTLYCRANSLYCQSLKIRHFPFKITNKLKVVLKLDSAGFDSKITVYG